jgi:hypothetical protein
MKKLGKSPTNRPEVVFSLIGSLTQKIPLLRMRLANVIFEWRPFSASPPSLEGNDKVSPKANGDKNPLKSHTKGETMSESERWASQSQNIKGT